MNRLKERSYTKYIQKYAEQHHDAVAKTSEYLAMLWVMLLHAFDLNAVWVLAKSGEKWQEICSFARDLSRRAPKPLAFQLLIEAAYSGGQAVSTQTDEMLNDGNVFVEATAAIPIAYDGSRKILLIYKQAILSRSEFEQEYVFTSYMLQDYMNLVETYVSVHEHKRNLARSEKLLQLGDVTSDLSHEIEQLLDSVVKNLDSLKGFIESERHQIVTDSYEPTDFFKRLEKSVQPPLEKAKHLHAKLLMLQKYASTNPWDCEYVDINVLIENMLKSVRDQVKHVPEISENYGENLKKIQCPTKRLRLVFLNLLENAADAVGDNGEIRIKTWQDYKYTYVQVKDNGPGIPPDNLAKIFSLDFSTKRDGLGIGLYISQRILRELGGTIEVNSEPGKGASFTVKLPMVASAFEFLR